MRIIVQSVSLWALAAMGMALFATAGNGLATAFASHLAACGASQ